MTSYNRAQNILLDEKNLQHIDFKPATENEIKEFSTKLNVQLPTDYIRFLKEFGSLSFKSLDIAGVLSGPGFSEFENYSNAQWLTLSERRDNGLPEKYIILSDSGMGEWYVLDTITGRIELIDDVDFQLVPGEPEESYDSFSDFLYKKVKEYDEMD